MDCKRLTIRGDAADGFRRIKLVWANIVKHQTNEVNIGPYDMLVDFLNTRFLGGQAPIQTGELSERLQAPRCVLQLCSHCVAPFVQTMDEFVRGKDSCFNTRFKAF